MSLHIFHIDCLAKSNVYRGSTTLPLRIGGPLIERTDVVTVFLQSENGILLGRRSDDVRTYKGHWAGISGYLEESDPEKQAERELREETGLSPGECTLIRSGEPLEIDDEPRYWRVHPFLFRTDHPEQIDLDWEHTVMEWTDPNHWNRRKTVPGLLKAWERVQ